MAKVYNCIVNHGIGKMIKYRGVNHLAKFVKFLDNQYGEHTNQRWNFFNVYDKEDKSESNNILASYQNGKNRNVPTTKDI